jgi:tetratricopeptide (TPR) repeat protein
MGRGPVTAAAVFVLMAGPVLGLISIYYMRYSLFSDHFQYLPSMSLIALLVATADGLIQRLSVSTAKTLSQVQMRYLRFALAGIVLLILSAKSFHDCGKFHDIETLWQDTLAGNPAAWIAHNNLGTMLKDGNDTNRAIVHLTQAVRLKPDHARAHLNLASAYINRQEYEPAAEHLEIALRYLPRDGQAHLNLANILSNRKQNVPAEQHFKEALQLLPPDDPIPRYNYALLLIDVGRIAEAEEQLRLALRAKPNWGPAKEVLQQMLASRPG